MVSPFFGDILQGRTRWGFSVKERSFYSNFVRMVMTGWEFGEGNEKDGLSTLELD